MPVLAMLLALPLSGCSDDTAILLEIESTDVVVPADIDGVRVRVVGLESGRITDRVFRETLARTWPQSVAILPGAGSSSEMVRIAVYGYRGNVERVRKTMMAQFVEGSTVEVRVNLDRACLDVLCTDPDAGCVAGMCVGEIPPDGGPPDMAVPDMRSDMGGLDMQSMDMERMETGSSDTGSSDTGPSDMDDGGALDRGVDLGVDLGPPPRYEDLLISEYVEGSSFNKAIELFNEGSTLLTLAVCELELYRNGAAASTSSVRLMGTVASGSAFVVCGDRIADSSSCDMQAGGLSHNGNDAIALVCDGVLIDSFGANTGDPGAGWTGGGVTTVDQTLRRLCSVSTRDTNLSDAFDPSTEYMEFPVDTFDGLGARACPATP